jgi:hypothetical protein
VVLERGVEVILILILDIHDHSLTFTPFSIRLTNGAIANCG